MTDRLSLGVVIVALVGGLVASAAHSQPVALASPQPAAHGSGSTKGSSPWTTYVWDSRFSSLHANQATTPSGAVAGFPLQSTMTALLTTTTASGLVGNLTGKTVSATMSLTASGPVTYGFEGSSQNNCTQPASAWLFFSTDSRTYSPNTAGRNETGYWWSHDVSVPMSGSISGATISVALVPGNWSDANGHMGSDQAYTAGFNSAVAGVKQIGVSFGGGCFFDVGIGMTSGSGSFSLDSIAAQ
jgi:hypothetical protein